jgi:predicted phage terminase large subunit-like protein
MREQAQKAKRVRRVPLKFADVADVFAKLTPQYEYPAHFAGYIDTLAGCIGAALRLVFAAPPQHGKTVATLNSLLYIVRKYPGLHHAYMTYSVEKAREVAKQFKALCELAGIEVKGTLGTLHLPNGVTLRFTSADKGLNGSPVNGLFVVDDFYKDQQQADSEAQRTSRDIAWRGSVIPRMHPGASIVILATRWHPQDQSGKLIEEGYRVIELRAIAEEGDPLGREIGQPLWHARDLKFLEDQRVAMLDQAFQAMYQQRPRPRGVGVFVGVTYYTELPTIFQVAYGLDLAYTSDNKNDESVILRMYMVPGETAASDLFYVVDCQHGRYEVPEFSDVIKATWHGDGQICWRSSSTERGSAQLLRREPYSIPIRPMTPPGDKYVSATAVAIAWKQGRVLLPKDTAFPATAAWVPALIKQAHDFTGTGKEHDDMIDALGNAHAILTVGRSASDTSPARKNAAGAQPQVERPLTARRKSIYD